MTPKQLATQLYKTQEEIVAIELTLDAESTPEEVRDFIIKNITRTIEIFLQVDADYEVFWTQVLQELQLIEIK